jgi:hypothetical protein
VATLTDDSGKPCPSSGSQAPAWEPVAGEAPTSSPLLLGCNIGLKEDANRGMSLAQSANRRGFATLFINGNLREGHGQQPCWHGLRRRCDVQNPEPAIAKASLSPTHPRSLHRQAWNTAHNRPSAHQALSMSGPDVHLDRIGRLPGACSGAVRTRYFKMENIGPGPKGRVQYF